MVEEVIKELQLLTERAEKEFGQMSEEQLNRKPAPEKWSIAEVLDHLIVTNRTYYKQFNEVIAGTHQNTFYRSPGIVSRFFGRQMIKDLGPGSAKKFKNPTLFAPVYSSITGNIITDFREHQNELLSYFQKLKTADLNKTVIHSPVSGLIIYNLADALTIIVVHEQRHMNQASYVKNNMA